MKKVLALVASAMMLVAGGLFVSCSDEGTTDAFVIGQGYDYRGTFSGSGTAPALSGYSSIKADESEIGTVSWDVSKGNVKTYQLEVPYSYVSGGVRYLDKASITIEKIGSKYYLYEKGYPVDKRTEVKVSSGSLESSSFTITLTYDDVTFTDLKFTRAK